MALHSGDWNWVVEDRWLYELRVPRLFRSFSSAAECARTMMLNYIRIKLPDSRQFRQLYLDTEAAVILNPKDLDSVVATFTSLTTGAGRPPIEVYQVARM